MIDDNIFREQNVLEALENGEEKQNEFLIAFITIIPFIYI